MKKILIFLLPLTFFLSPTQALANVGLSVSQPVTEVLIAPNKSLRTTIQLTNNGDDTSVIISLHSLIPTGELGHSTIDPKPLDQSKIPLVIRLAGSELDTPIPLASNQSLPITLDLEAANLDEAADVYFALLARPINQEANPLTSTTPGITALFLTTITPPPTLPTNITLVDPSAPILHDSYLPLNIRVEATNESKTMLQVQAKAKLATSNDQVISEQTVDPRLILGNSTRLLSTFTFQLLPTQIGPHTLTLELLTIGGRSLTTHSYTIWILPVRYLILIFTTLVLITVPIIRKIRLTSKVKKA